MQSSFLYLRTVKWSIMTLNACLMTRLKLNGPGGRNGSLSPVIFWACKEFQLGLWLLRTFLHVIAYCSQANKFWPIKCEQRCHVAGSRNLPGEMDGMCPLWHFLGLTSHFPVWNMDASGHALSESQYGILWLVTVGYCWHPRPRTKETSSHWYQEEEDCVEKAIHQEP